MLMIDPADDEITIFGCLFVFILLAIIGSVVFGLGFFFKQLDARMKRWLENYVANKNSHDEQK